MRILCSLVAGALLTSGASAEIVVQYGTEGGTTSLAPASVDAAVAADNLVAGDGIDVLNFSTFNFTNWDPENTSFADAFADNEFWSWGFDVTAPLTNVSLSTLDIRLDRSSTGPDDFEIQASVNGGTPLTILTHDFADSSSGVNFTDVDLSGLGTVTTGDSVEFILAAYNAESTGGTFDLETITFPGGSDGITINGTVTAIPEPGSLLALGALGGVIGVRQIRRRRKAVAAN